MPNNADPALVELYLRVQLCQQFPAYKLSDLDGEVDVAELMRARELLRTARQVLEP